MPWEDESYHLVVFDPPHLRHAGETGWQRKKYGVLGQNWKEDIKKGFDECTRVLKKKGTLIFKWNEMNIKISEIIEAIGVEPLFGTRTSTNNKTIWLVFFKN